VKTTHVPQGHIQNLTLSYIVHGYTMGQLDITHKSITITAFSKEVNFISYQLNWLYPISHVVWDHF
jgi:hypothetical protein